MSRGSAKRVGERMRAPDASGVVASVRIGISMVDLLKEIREKLLNSVADLGEQPSPTPREATVDSPFDKEARELLYAMRDHESAAWRDKIKGDYEPPVALVAEALRAVAERAWNEGAFASSESYGNPYTKPNQGER